MIMHLQRLLMSIALMSNLACVSPVFAQKYNVTLVRAQAQQGGDDIYDTNDPTPDLQREALPDLSRMGIAIARPANQAAVENALADEDETPPTVRRVTRRARLGAPGANAGAATGAQKPAAQNGLRHMPDSAVYGNLYGRDVYRTPW